MGVEPLEKEAFSMVERCIVGCRGEATSVNHWSPFTLSGANLIY